jgi:hypothetical protein
MKRIVIITVAVLLALSTGTQAFAKSEQVGNAEVDASLVWASAPTSGRQHRWACDRQVSCCPR